MLQPILGLFHITRASGLIMLPYVLCHLLIANAVRPPEYGLSRRNSTSRSLKKRRASVSFVVPVSPASGGHSHSISPTTSPHVDKENPCHALLMTGGASQALNLFPAAILPESPVMRQSFPLVLTGARC